MFTMLGQCSAYLTRQLFPELVLPTIATFLLNLVGVRDIDGNMTSVVIADC
jgi:hypothetical protein